MLLVIIFMGYGLIKVPMNSWSGRTVEHDLSYCYFNAAKSLALKEKIFEKLEEKYTVGAANQTLIMLLAKYRKIEGLSLEAYYLNQMHNQIPVHIIIELESKHKRSKVRREIHQNVLAKLANKIMTVNELVDFNSDLLQLIHRFNLSKTKYYKQIVDGVYFETLTETIKGNFTRLPQTTRGYYGKNWLFSCFPRLGRDF